MYLVIGVPVVMILLLLVVIAVWAWTGPIIAFVVFAGLCTVGVSVGRTLQRRSRGL